MRLRISRPRRDFGIDNYSYIEKDAGEQPTNIPATKNNFTYVTKKKVLEMGF